MVPPVPKIPIQTVSKVKWTNAVPQPRPSVAPPLKAVEIDAF